MNLTPNSKVIIQGITNTLSTHTAFTMKSYNTNVVAGISPGEGGQAWGDIPVFDLVEQAIAQVGIVDTSIILVPPYAVLDAANEAIAAGIKQIIIVTEGMPPLDVVSLVRKAEATETLVVGPNCGGIIMPNKLLLGTHPTQFYTPGKIGIISRSNTLTYEVAWELTQAKLGQSIAVSIGCDLIVGSSFLQWLQILDEDEHTEAIVLIGEIGGGSEEAAASYIAEAIDKPVIAYVAGVHTPSARVMSHAGSLMTSRASSQQLVGTGTAASKIATFKAVDIPVADRPSAIPGLLKKVLGKK